jgi:hypothetical protein
VKTKDVVIHVRITTEERELIYAIAQKELRSVSEYIREVLKRELKRQTK